MTEEEAKAKWCPFARPAGTRPDDCGEVRGNREMGGGPDVGAHCIASACMAWRKTKDVYVRATGQRSDRDLYGDGRWETEGFCGLAGAPQ